MLHQFVLDIGSVEGYEEACEYHYNGSQQTTQNLEKEKNGFLHDGNSLYYKERVREYVGWCLVLFQQVGDTLFQLLDRQVAGNNASLAVYDEIGRDIGQPKGFQ